MPYIIAENFTDEEMKTLTSLMLHTDSETDYTHETFEEAKAILLQGFKHTLAALPSLIDDLKAMRASDVLETGWYLRETKEHNKSQVS